MDWVPVLMSESLILNTSRLRHAYKRIEPLAEKLVISSEENFSSFCVNVLVSSPLLGMRHSINAQTSSIVDVTLVYDLSTSQSALTKPSRISQINESYLYIKCSGHHLHLFYIFKLRVTFNQNWRLYIANPDLITSMIWTPEYCEHRARSRPKSTTKCDSPHPPHASKIK